MNQPSTKTRPASRMRLAAVTVLTLAIAVPASAADLILDHVDIVDVEQRTIIRDGQIVITGGVIEHAGPRQASPPTGVVRDASGLVAVPGFINVHTHLWQHASRGLATSGDLQTWAGIVHQFVHYATREEMYEATFVAARQGLLSGFTTTSDFAAPYSDFLLDATNTAIRDAGVDGVVMWWNPAVFLPPEVKRKEMRRFAQAIRPLRLWVAQGHAFLFEIPALYEGIRLAAELDLGLSEHTLETIGGIRQAYGLNSGYLTRYGARLDPADRARIEALLRPGAPPPVNRVPWMRRLARQTLQAEEAAGLRPDDRALLERWADLPASFSVAAMLDFLGAFDLAHPYVMIHGVWADDADLALFAENGVMVAHNPESNMRLSSGIAPIWQMLDQDITVGLGTDGAASNDGINAFSAMRAAWNLQKMEQLHALQTGKEIDAWTILRMATLEGAKVLGIADRTGSITAGKEADLVLLSKGALSMSPIITADHYDTLVPMIVYSADARAIDTVIASGQVEVEDGRLVGGPSEAELAARLDAVANAVMARQAAGKTWSEHFDLADMGDQTWYRYRSIRDVDTIALTLVNSGSAPRSVLLAFSGVPEGGATAPMLSADTLARFPLDPPERYWSRQVRLAPGETVTIDKPAGGYDYVIGTARGEEKRAGAAEQLLLLVDG